MTASKVISSAAAPVMPMPINTQVTLEPLPKIDDSHPQIFFVELCKLASTPGPLQAQFADLVVNMPDDFKEQCKSGANKLTLGYNDVANIGGEQRVRLVIEEATCTSAADQPEFSTEQLETIWGAPNATTRFNLLQNLIKEKMAHAPLNGVGIRFKLTMISDKGKVIPMRNNTRPEPGAPPTPWLKGYKSLTVDITQDDVPHLIPNEAYKALHHYAVFCSVLKQMEGQNALYITGEGEGREGRGNSTQRIWFTPVDHDALFSFGLTLRQNPKNGGPAIGLTNVEFRGLTTLGVLSGGAAQRQPARKATEPEVTRQPVSIPDLSDLYNLVDSLPKPSSSGLAPTSDETQAAGAF